MWGERFLGEGAYQELGAASGERGSHGCSTSQKYFDAAEEAEGAGEAQKGIPTVAAYPGIF